MIDSSEDENAAPPKQAHAAAASSPGPAGEGGVATANGGAATTASPARSKAAALFAEDEEDEGAGDDGSHVKKSSPSSQGPAGAIPDAVAPSKPKAKKLPAAAAKESGGGPAGSGGKKRPKEEGGGGGGGGGGGSGSSAEKKKTKKAKTTGAAAVAEAKKPSSTSSPSQQQQQQQQQQGGSKKKKRKESTGSGSGSGSASAGAGAASAGGGGGGGSASKKPPLPAKPKAKKPQVPIEVEKELRKVARMEVGRRKNDARSKVVSSFKREAGLYAPKAEPGPRALEGAVPLDAPPEPAPSVLSALAPEQRSRLIACSNFLYTFARPLGLLYVPSLQQLVEALRVLDAAPAGAAPGEGEWDEQDEAHAEAEQLLEDLCLALVRAVAPDLEDTLGLHTGGNADALEDVSIGRSASGARGGAGSGLVLPLNKMTWKEVARLSLATFVLESVGIQRAYL